MMDKEITTLSTKTVYANKWMRVREDAIERSDGSRGIYGVVEKPDFAVIAAVEDGCVHLVEQYRYPVGKRYWELPQGSWEGSSIEPLELAKAELKEETGLIAKEMRHLGHLYVSYGYATQGYDMFLATDLRQCETDLDAEELGLISRRFKIEDVIEMIKTNQIKDSVTVSAIGMLNILGVGEFS